MAGRCRRASNPLGRISLSGHKIPAFRLSVDRFNTGSLSTMYEVNNNLGFYYSEWRSELLNPKVSILYSLWVCLILALLTTLYQLKNLTSCES